MSFCDVCNESAVYYVTNPGSNAQYFCEEHFPKFLKTTMPFVTTLTKEQLFTSPVVEEPVVEVVEDVHAVPKTPTPKPRKKAAAIPAEEPVTE